MGVPISDPEPDCLVRFGGVNIDIIHYLLRTSNSPDSVLGPGRSTNTVPGPLGNRGQASDVRGRREAGGRAGVHPENLD